MLRISLLTVCMLMVCAFVVTAEEAEKPWIDMEKCAYCKNFDMELAKHMKTEYHNLTNGIMSVTVIEKDHKPMFMKAMEAMEAVTKQIGETGQVPYMCGHCTKYGELMMAGAKMEHVHGDLAEIYVATADKPELVTELQAFGKRNAEEFGKMAAAMETEKPK